MTISARANLPACRSALYIIIVTHAQVAHDSCVVTVVDPLSHRQTCWQFSAVDSCVVALGEPLSPRWTRRQFA